MGDRWSESTATIVDGRVLVTPVDFDQLYCLNLLDGQLQWKLERENLLYVACVDRGNVILAGRDQLLARSLSEKDPEGNTPKKVWSVKLPEGSMPSGRGFYSGHSYFLPLSTAEVIEVDLADGRIISRARSRTGEVPGNLICHHGEIISQDRTMWKRFTSWICCADKWRNDCAPRRMIPALWPSWVS